MNAIRLCLQDSQHSFAVDECLRVEVEMVHGEYNRSIMSDAGGLSTVVWLDEDDPNESAEPSWSPVTGEYLN